MTILSALRKYYLTLPVILSLCPMTAPAGDFSIYMGRGMQGFFRNHGQVVYPPGHGNSPGYNRATGRIFPYSYPSAGYYYPQNTVPLGYYHGYRHGFRDGYTKGYFDRHSHGYTYDQHQRLERRHQINRLGR